MEVSDANQAKRKNYFLTICHCIEYISDKRCTQSPCVTLLCFGKKFCRPNWCWWNYLLIRIPPVMPYCFEIALILMTNLISKYEWILSSSLVSSQTYIQAGCTRFLCSTYVDFNLKVARLPKTLFTNACSIC